MLGATSRHGSRILLLASLVLLSGCASGRRVDVIEISDHLQELLTLPTYEHRYRDVVYFGEEKSFLFIKTVDRAVLFAVDIRVRAGLDLTQKITLTRDRTDRSRIYVRLPRAQILSVDADEGSIKEYFVREQGGSIGLLEFSQQLDEVKNRTANDAIQRGILDRADENARSIVKNFLELAGFSQVVFSESEPETPELQG